ARCDIPEKQRKPFKRLASKCGSHTALKCGVNERLSGRAWRLTEWSRRDPADMDGKPEGGVIWRKRSKRPTTCPCLNRILCLPSSWEATRMRNRFGPPHKP